MRRLITSSAQVLVFITFLAFLGNAWATGDWQDASVGSAHTIALKVDGRVFATGLNSSGQLGDGTTTQSNMFKQVATGANDVAAYDNVSYILKTDGTVWKTDGSGGWTQTLSGVTKLQEHAKGVHAIKNDGSTWNANNGIEWTIGGNSLKGYSYNENNPSAITSSYISINADNSATVYMKPRYDVVLWNTSIASVKEVAGSAGIYWAGAYTIYGNGYFALKTDNTLWSVGTNYYGGWGTGSSMPSSYTSSFAQIFDKVTHVWATEFCTFALRDDGNLWVAGFNGNGTTPTGLFGDGTTNNTITWKTTASGVASAIPGLTHSILVKTDGTLWVTGSNAYGQHGLGDATNRTVWTQTGIINKLTVSKGDYSNKIALSWDNNGNSTPTQFEIYRSVGNNGVKSLIATVTGLSYDDTSVVETKLYTYYVKDIGNGAQSSIEYGYIKVPDLIPTATGDWQDASVGTAHTIALKTDGRVFVTGLNSSGQLGDGTTSQSNIFKQVATGASDVAAYGNVSYILKTDATVWKTEGSGGWTQTLSGVTKLQEHAKGVNAIKSDGSTWNANNGIEWKNDANSLKGYSYNANNTSAIASSYIEINPDNSASSYNKPVNENAYWNTSIADVKEVAGSAGIYWAGAYTIYGNGYFALKTDNTLWSVGTNYYGGWGTGSSMPSSYTSSFAQIFDKVTHVWATEFCTFALRDDGNLWVAGFNGNGTTPTGLLGDGTTNNTITWKTTASGVASAIPGLTHSILVKTDGTLWVTGSNTYGQHGLGDAINRTVWTQTGLTQPGKVTGVNASDGTQYNKVTVSWTADPYATQYEVYRSTAAGTKGAAVTTNATGTSYDDTTVSGLTHYFYTVVAKNPAGSGPDSDQNEGYGKIPAPLSTLNATQGTVYSKVQLNWTADPDANGYEVWRSTTTGGTATQIGTATAPAATYDDTTVTGGTHYYYTIKTLVGSTTGQPSNEVQGWAKMPVTITTLSATQGTQVGKVGLSWAPDQDATSYQVWRTATSGGVATQIGTVTTPAATFNDTNVVGVASYFYIIKTMVGTMVGPASNEAEGWSDGPPTAASVTLTASSTTASSATAAAVTDPNVTAGQAESYTFAITTQPVSGSVTVVSNKFIYTPPADGLFSGALTFGFTVTDKGGQTFAATGKINVMPDVISTLTATQGTRIAKVTLAWSPDVNATGYEVWRSTTAGGTATRIATLAAPASGVDDTTVSGTMHYYYTVKTVVGGLTGLPSNEVQGWAKLPVALTSLTATQGTQAGKVTLAWPSDSEATGYEVWRSTTAGGATTKIATMTVPSTGTPDTTVVGVASYFYTVKTLYNAVTGPASNEAEGWADGAPTAASVTLTAGSNSPSSATDVTVTDPNVTAGKTEAYTLAITTQPTYGTVTQVSNKFVYTPPVSGTFSGALTFGFTVTDKGGQSLASTGMINVVCGSPIISAFTLSTTNVAQAAPFTSSSTFSLPACSTNSQIKVDVIDSSGTTVIAGTFVSTANGTGLTHDFTSKGLVTAGSYTVRLTADSDSGVATKTATLTVKAVNLPTLTIAPGLSVNVGEEIVTANLSNPTVVNCPFTSDVTVAQADSSKCYVLFTAPPNGMIIDSSGTLPSLAGALNDAGSFLITAEVHRFDGTALVKVGQVSKTVTASCGAPLISMLSIPSLLPYEVPNYSATYKAFACNGILSGTMTITNGATVVETMNLSALDYGAAANIMKGGTGLPEGNYIALLNITGSSGTGSKSQSFSVKAAPTPTLLVSPTTLSQGETRIDISLQPSTDTTCPLTTDISLAQADPKRCYVELTTTVPGLTTGLDARGLPIMAGYPAIAGDYTVQAVISRWVNGNRYDANPLTKAVKVTEVIAPTFVFTGKSSVYAGIEKLSLIFKQNTGSVCNLFSDQAIAKSQAENGTRACFVSFTGDTDLTKYLSLNQYKIEGSLTHVGTQTLAYTVKRAFADGTTVDVQTGELPIIVNNLPPPMVTLKGGYKITEGKYYVPLGQAITRATITAGVPTTAKMKISINDSQQAFERAGIMSGGSYWISTPALGLLEQRLVTLRVAWQDYPAIYNEQVITAVGGTENNMKLVIDTPQQVADTDPITVKVKVGKYTKTGVSYTPDTMGQWRTQILMQSNNQVTKTPITERVDMVDGEATFQISPVGNLFMKLTAVAQLVTSVEGLDSTLASSTRFVEIVKGSPIEGAISAKTLDAPAPKTFSLNLDMSVDNRVAIKEVTWQESDDGGVTWTSIEKSNTIVHNIGMQTPGKRQARARMVNKNTLAESFTDPVEVWAYATLDAQITGPSHMAPGYTATLASELYRGGVLTTDTVNEWTIQAPSGTTVTNGATATITEALEGKVNITLKTRPADTRADDPNAWSYARYYLAVKTPAKPSVSANGHRDVETGKLYHYEGGVRPSWGSIVSVNATQSEWQLPDGSTVAGTALDWVPGAQDLIAKKPLIFRAWVEGFKDTTTSQMTISYVPWEYIWPEFTMTMKQLTVQAPSDLLLMVNYNQPSMSRRFEGLTYTWSFPENVTGRQNAAFANQAAAHALFAGEYDVTVTIQDARGHRTVLTQHIVTEQAVPYTVTLKVGKSNLFDRVPMTVTVRPTINGGHPLDRVIEQIWKVDGIPVKEYTNRDFMLSNITSAGDHVISYTINSKMGETTTVNSPLQLLANQLPVCNLKATPNVYVVYAEAKCADPDGKVVGYSWRVNGEPIGSTSYRISFNKEDTPQSASVTIAAMDDARELSMPVTINVNY